MTREDVDRLFLLLRELYPRIMPRIGPNAKSAWFVVLQPYEYDAVKQKLLEWNRSRDGRTFPDPRECIPSQQQDAEPARRSASVRDILEAMDGQFGFWRHGNRDPQPDSYLAALDEWEASLDKMNFPIDHPTRKEIEKKKKQIEMFKEKNKKTKRNGEKFDA